MEKVLVSACLMGARVRHDGTARALENQLLATWRTEGRLISLCPEMAAGLPTPRAPVEIAPGASATDVLRGRAALYDRDGLDMTGDFLNAANLALDVAQENGCRFALLTDGSPSCGSTFVHSGEFNGQTHAGEGVVAARLRAAGMQIFAQHQLADLARALEDAENSE